MKNAVPTTRGWVHPKTGELLKAQKMSQKKVNQLLGVEEPVPKIEEVVDVVYGAPTPEIEEPQRKTSFFKKLLNQ